MEKYRSLEAAGFLSRNVIEPADMTTQMLSAVLHEINQESQALHGSSAVALRAFFLIRQEELRIELHNRVTSANVAGRYSLTSPGFGVHPDMFEAEELHHTEWQKSIDRLIRERDLIESSGVKALARFVFIEIRLAEFRNAIRQSALAA